MKYTIQATFSGRTFFLDAETDVPNRTLLSSKFLWDALQARTFTDPQHAMKWMAVILKANLKHLESLTINVEG